MPSPTQYSSARQGFGTSLGSNVADLGPVADVNFSGQTLSDGTPSVFTVAGWVRLLTTPLTGNQVLFQSSGPFQITLNQSGYIVADFAPTGASTNLVSETAITDLDWHFIGASFLPEPNAGGHGSLQLYLDGILVGSADQQVAAPTTAQNCLLGPNALSVEFASWTIWSTAKGADVMNVPLLGEPTQDTDPAVGLVNSYDFANGAALDQNNTTVPVGALVALTPCAQISPQGMVGSSDQIAIGSGPFTAMIWFCGQTPDNSSYNLMSLTDNTGDQFALVASFNEFQSASAGYAVSAGGNPPIQTVAQIGAIPGWTHVAVTGDGAGNGTLYINGVAQRTASLAIPSITSNVQFGTSLSLSPKLLLLQNAMFWSVALGPADIVNYMQGADPVGSDGLVAFYPFVEDFSNTVTSNSAAPVNARIMEQPVQISTSDAQAAAAAPRLSSRLALTATAAAADIPVMQLSDYERLAEKHGIDTKSRPDISAMAASPEFAHASAWFEKLLHGAPPQTAARIRERFHRNLSIAKQLHDKGVRTGGFEVKTEGRDTVIHYHTENGPQEVGRLVGQVLSPFVQWCLTIFIDVVGLIAAMFGIVTTAAKVTKAVGPFDEILEAIGNAARSASGSSPTSKACSAIFNVMKTMYEWKILFSLFKKLISGSWWSLAFTCLSLVAQVAAIVASGGWLIAIKVAEMAIAIAQLIYDLTQMPSNAEAAAPETGAATA